MAKQESEQKVKVSRVGRQPIAIPGGVQVEVDGHHVVVKGPRGTLQRDFVDVSIEVTAGLVRVLPEKTTPSGRALHGLGRNLLRNMVVGVSEGFKRELQVVGVGYRCEVVGREVRLALGYSHPSVFVLPEGIDAAVEAQNRLVLSGIDKELLGQTAASIRDLRRPEPYKGKGVRYADEHVRTKVGKATGKK